MKRILPQSNERAKQEEKSISKYKTLFESRDLQSPGSLPGDCAVVRNPALVHGRVFARAGHAIAHPAFAA